jgi:hypothetical protein
VNHVERLLVGGLPALQVAADALGR